MTLSIEVQNISKTFGYGATAVKALDNVSLQVSAGEIYGFVGANGAGKSTTMRIIMGVLNADAGADTVKLFGEAATADLRHLVGYMPAERGLYGKAKIAGQLTYFARLHGVKRKDAAKKAAFWIERLGLGEYATKKLEELSTGNQQRVQLATALISEPKALILDEPFSGLDPIAVANFMQILREQAKNGVAIIFSSHQLDLIDRISDRVGIIKQGKMIVQGTPDELRQIEHEQSGTPLEVTIPTPLTDIFGKLVEDDLVNRAPFDLSNQSVSQPTNQEVQSA